MHEGRIDCWGHIWGPNVFMLSFFFLIWSFLNLYPLYWMVYSLMWQRQCFVDYLWCLQLLLTCLKFENEIYVKFFQYIVSFEILLPVHVTRFEHSNWITIHFKHLSTLVKKIFKERETSMQFQKKVWHVSFWMKNDTCPIYTLSLVILCRWKSWESNVLKF